MADVAAQLIVIQVQVLHRTDIAQRGWDTAAELVPIQVQPLYANYPVQVGYYCSILIGEAQVTQEVDTAQSGGMLLLS